MTVTQDCFSTCYFCLDVWFWLQLVFTARFHHLTQLGTGNYWPTQEIWGDLTEKNEGHSSRTQGYRAFGQQSALRFKTILLTDWSSFGIWPVKTDHWTLPKKGQGQGHGASGPKRVLLTIDRPCDTQLSEVFGNWPVKTDHSSLPEVRFEPLELLKAVHSYSKVHYRDPWLRLGRN